GSDRALLEDTGAGPVDTSSAVMDVVAQWAKRNKKDSVPLIVMHSHGHGDHTSGDAQFKDKPNIQFVAATVPEVQKAFAIEHLSWITREEPRISLMNTCWSCLAATCWS